MRRRGSVLGLAVCAAVTVVLQALGVLPADARWARARDVPGTETLYDISCRPDGSCLAVGSTSDGLGAVVVLHANGAVGPVRAVPGSEVLTAIACSAGGNCIAIGEERLAPVVVQIGSDGTPGAVRAVPGADDLWRVACPTATTCLATGSVLERLSSYPYYLTWSVFVVITNGQPAPAQRFPLEADWVLTGLACPSATKCIAVNGKVAVLTEAGGTWTARMTADPAPQTGPIPPGHVTDDISCGSASRCFATAVAFVAAPGGGFIGVPATVAVSADGVLGQVQIVTDQPGNSTAISCPIRTGTCTVTVNLHSGAAQGLVVETVRGSPTTFTYWTNVDIFTGVSCVTAESCGLVGIAEHGVFGWKGPVLP